MELPPHISASSAARYPALRREMVRSNRVVISTLVCIGILIPLLLISPSCFHWFVIPLFGCGVICGVDGLRILEPKGRQLFNPSAMVGVFGMYFFYIAPILHVVLDYWFTSTTIPTDGAPDDWRVWLGLMGLINLGGLSLYQWSRRSTLFQRRKIKPAAVYEVDLTLLRFYGPVLLSVAFIAQVYIYAKFGGIGGFISAFNNIKAGDTTFQGLGWLMCIAESFPTLLLIVWAAQYRGESRRWGILGVSVMIPVMFPLILIFGGLRGSRGNTVYAIMYVLGIVHLNLRRVTWRAIAILSVAVVAFMYIYGFYKVNENTFIEAISSLDTMSYESERTGRSLDAVLLGDMDRADVQAFELFEIAQKKLDVTYGLGRTYLDSALNFIPHALMANRPPGKLKYGTDLFFGEGTYVPDPASGFGFVSTKIYGLAGEAMLNWGPVAPFISFWFFGWFVARVQIFNDGLSPLDSRRYLAPIIAICCVVIVSSDLDNVLYVLLRQALMPGILVGLCSRRRRLVRRPQALVPLPA